MKKMTDQDGARYCYKTEEEKMLLIKSWENGCPAPEILTAFALEQEKTDFVHIEIKDVYDKVKKHVKKCFGCGLAVKAVRQIKKSDKH
jgi:hypothetical protein